MKYLSAFVLAHGDSPIFFPRRLRLWGYLYGSGKITYTSVGETEELRAWEILFLVRLA